MRIDTNVFILMFLLAVFVLVLIWYSKKYIISYLQFSNITPLPYILKYNLMQKKNVPVTSYFFQTAIDVCNRFQSEGFFICWAPRPLLCIFEEEAMKIFSNERSLIDKVIEFEMLKEVFGSGLLTSNGEKWIKRKKLLNPIFHITMVKDKVSIVSKNAVVLVEKLREMKNEPIEILKFLQMCSFNNISEFLIGRDINDSKTTVELEKIMASISKGTRMVVYRILHPWLAPNFTMQLFSEGRNYIKMMEDAHKNSKKVLQEKTEEIISAKVKEEEDGFRKKSPPSFMQILIEHHLKDPSFTFDDVLHEFNTFISAGYDTLSYGMMWCLFLVGHHPEVQEQIYEEVQTVMKNDTTYDELKNFKYTDCVIKEALRLYPPLPLYGRVLAKPVSWRKYTVPEGTSVAFFPFMAHRNPKVFPDPEKFDPDRFLDVQDDKKPTTYTFAEGARNCLGKKFAEIEMKITLAHIIKNFKITSLDRREDIRLNWEGFLTTVEPLRIRLDERKQNLIQD